jgi:hypothetical protein
MVMENFNGQLAINTKVIMLKTNDKVMEKCIGSMVISIKVFGKKEFRMA